MRVLLCFLGVIAFTASQFASADVIDSVVVNDGTMDITLSVANNAGGTAPNYPSGASAALQSFVSGGVTYNTLVGADGYVGDVEGVLAPVGTAAGAFPTASVALSDLDISTGSLDPYGDGTFVGNEFFDFQTQTIDNNTVFFLFSNATGPTDVALVDSTGADISTSLNFNDDLGGEAQINDFTFSRTNGADLDNREVFGNIFAVNEFTLNAGSTVADIAGFRGSFANFDAQDAGIAFATAVPEPSSAMILAAGLTALLVRHRK